MATGQTGTYRYLDGDDERRELVADIARVRRAVVQFAESQPPTRHYEPRYHGWTLAAMLAHLHTVDSLALMQIQMSLLGVRPPLPLPLVNWLNDRMARVFRERLVTTTLKGIRSREKRIADLILRLPMDKFSKPVYHPPSESYLTVERVVQAYFLNHWQEHLQTMQRAEGIFYEPPERYDTL
jgi:hypothetical protein